VGGRERIFAVHSRNKPLDNDVDLKLLARQTSGLTGADLANICNEAAIFAARRGSTTVAMADFDSALERVVAGMQSRRALTDHEKRVVAYHEAGHALCGELLPSVDRVHRISIVPRGKALGYTLNLPEEDRYLKTREELIDFMTMLLGGRAAEQIVFGSITTGASDDLKRVADIAHAMIHEYAMGTGVRSHRVLSDSTAEATRRVHDAEVQDLADEAFRSAISILDSHRPQLDELARTLLSNEVLERDDIDRIMGGVPKAAPERIGRGELGIAAATAVKPSEPRRPA
jgi:cell division protease FtsH